jgi:DNA repair protein RadC
MKEFVYEFRTRRVRKSMAAEALAPYGEAHSPRATAEIVRKLTAGEAREYFVTLFLDVTNALLGYELTAIGQLEGVHAHPREIFRTAILTSAAAIVVSHNHPSGNTTPSDLDKILTTRIRKAGELIGIPMLDHVIVTDQAYFSMAESYTELP